jgi:hypothetical protein
MTEQEQKVRSTQICSLPEPDLRRHRRYLCVDGSVLRLAVRPEFRGRRALLFDVSSGGLGFLLDIALEVGAVLAFELPGPEGTDSMTRVARVRHCRPYAVPPSAPWLPATPAFRRFLCKILGLHAPQKKAPAWIIGCEFDRPLSEHEIRQLLGNLKELPSEPHG